MKMAKILSALLIISMIFTGCTSQKKVADNSQTETDGGNTAKKVLVGTEGTYNPFTYKDENGQLTGYDIDVVKEIDKRIDDIDFEFLPTPWDSMFLGLESKKYDMIADQISKDSEREKKYSFSNNSYFISAAHIIVKKDNNKTINGLDDLKGLKVG
ncbi:MAG TPA: ABC transporter substrate-binding protein, partial [Clostridiaceae bacterium]|nr:ABC transporter substrate-binding protein [Clostridiaceae bacterium]